ncbi:hypothetical protein Fmac_005577 [Flemingia macrophylla]|uniref:Cytochrome P450 n=1 Tax=Flemingia macrophylla TaxID=520843 RepID=A0ABD1N860_9FABA
METCLVVVIVSLCLCILFMKFKSFSSRPLPPCHLHIPLISDITWLRASFLELHLILHNLIAKHGPIFTLRFFSTPFVFIADHSLAHQALIQNGAVFANRPKTLSSGQLNISSSSYGATWRLLRRNLSSTVLHPSFSGIRKRVLHDLLNRLKNDVAETSHSVVMVKDQVQHAMFTLILFMCFGEAVERHKIQDIERIQRSLVNGVGRFSVLSFLPNVFARVLFPTRWHELLQLRKAQKDVFVRFIKARKGATVNIHDHGGAICYVDTLLNLRLPEGDSALDEGDVVSLCSEFLTSGMDTTSTALEWVMANLVKHPHVQRRVVEEIGEVVVGEREVKEEDLNKLPYLKAVILEGLRRHPPSHLLMPHAVSEDVVLNGYLVPKNGVVNFAVAEMGCDPKVWEDPMAFKPERFLRTEQFDITGSRDIKMMPFGAGRRACPAHILAMHHLQYFVANLVWNFEWKAFDEGNVDLSTKQEFTVVMKHPLRARVYPRF